MTHQIIERKVEFNHYQQGKKRGGKIITNFAGVRPKINALKIQKDDSEIQRAKGVKKSASKDITFDDFDDIKMY